MIQEKLNAYYNNNSKRNASDNTKQNKPSQNQIRGVLVKPNLPRPYKGHQRRLNSKNSQGNLQVPEELEPSIQPQYNHY